MTTAAELLSKNYARIGLDDTVAKLLGALKTSGHSAALVFDGTKYAGVVEKHFLANSHIDANTMKVKNAAEKRSKGKTPFYVPTLSPEDDFSKMAKAFTSAGTNMLPVIDKKKGVLGVVRANDLVVALNREYKGVACSKLASMKLVTCGPEDSVGKAILLISKAGIDHLPVVDKTGALLGMVGMSDILGNNQLWNAPSMRISSAASHQGGKRTGYSGGEKTSLLSLPVKNFMSKKNNCCTKSETTIPNAVEQMCAEGVSSIVLVKNDKAVGILTVRDVLKDYAKS